MRVHYDRRGRIRGYSGGIGTYYWLQLLQIAFLLLIIIPVLFVLLAGALICILGWGVATVLRKPSAAASWRSAASSTIGVAGRFGHWSDRQQGLETQPRAARHPTTPKPSAARQPTVTSGPTLYNVRCPNCSAALQSTASEKRYVPEVRLPFVGEAEHPIHDGQIVEDHDDRAKTIDAKAVHFERA